MALAMASPPSPKLLEQLSESSSSSSAHKLTNGFSGVTSPTCGKNRSSVFFPEPANLEQSSSSSSSVKNRAWSHSDSGHILSPTNVAPPATTDWVNPAKEAVFTFDHLVQSQTETGTRPGSASRARRLQTGASLDAAHYRNDEELRNLFNSGSQSSQTDAEPRKTAQGSLEEDDWNDFQGHETTNEEKDGINLDKEVSLSMSRISETPETVTIASNEKLEQPTSEVNQLNLNDKAVIDESSTSDQGDSEVDEEIDEADDEIEEEDEEEVVTEDYLIDDENTSVSGLQSLLYGRVQQMEGEQEMLNNSLLALTSHFAQVQLRLRQIVEAKDVPVEKRESLLAELESFANRGIPELMLSLNSGTTGGRPLSGAPGNLERSVSMATSLMVDDVFEEEEDGDNEDGGNSKFTGERSELRNYLKNGSCDEVEPRSRHESVSTTATGGWITEEKLERQRSRQKELICQLKEQLEDLERYAYETGDLGSLPSSMLLERQNAIIEQLKAKLPVLSIDEIDKLNPEELRKKVDTAVKELVNPVLMKEQLVGQLKTQITDLERFIEFLQKGGNDKEKHRHLLKAAAASSSSSSSKFAQMSSFLKLKRSKTTNVVSAKSEPSNVPKAEIKVPRSYSKRRHASRHSSTTSATSEQVTCDTPKSEAINQKSNGPSNETGGSNAERSNTQTPPINGVSSSTTEPNEATMNVMNRIFSLLSVYAWTQFGGCASFARSGNSSNAHRPKTQLPYEKNATKRQTRHWGDLRAHLELSISAILELYREKQLNSPSPYTTSEGADFISFGDTALVINNYFTYEQITKLVRKDLAVALRNLIQHGLSGAGEPEYGVSSELVPRNGFHPPKARASLGSGAQSGGSSLLSFGLGCFGASAAAAVPSITHAPVSRPVHAWELILYFYDLKNGQKLRQTPSRRLSQSFGLQVLAGAGGSTKTSLLSAVDEIIDTHTRHRRSLDAHFKAFISMGLNQQMLSQWLRLILRNQTILNQCYEPWSYTASTGFEDALRQLDQLAKLRFCLPTDVALRQLQSIHDAF